MISSGAVGLPVNYVSLFRQQTVSQEKEKVKVITFKESIFTHTDNLYFRSPVFKSYSLKHHGVVYHKSISHQDGRKKIVGLASESLPLPDNFSSRRTVRIIAVISNHDT